MFKLNEYLNKLIFVIQYASQNTDPFCTGQWWKKLIVHTEVHLEVSNTLSVVILHLRVVHISILFLIFCPVTFEL